ncbi:hypothetical protein [Cellulomonas rhizosphaerae]|uniref:Uncharacterized protein n=1 Tax=Cellulomonas rhizosphaerae TaxID=2293719 RepID=A0A413RRB5_9CELL|nr:hypothetical protein [Cellulomonas rhizosphaerae]RHA44478.1 hypothetical protein D1825_01035 [Cellulomonas rhizosphaerae]
MAPKFPDPTADQPFPGSYPPPGTVPGMLAAPARPHRRRRALAITLTLTLLVAVATVAVVVVPAVLDLRGQLTSPHASAEDAATARQLDQLAGQWQATLGDFQADYLTSAPPADEWLATATPLAGELSNQAAEMRALAAQIATDELDTAAAELADSVRRATGYAQGLVAAVTAGDPATIVDQHGALRFATLEAEVDRTDLQTAMHAAGID